MKTQLQLFCCVMMLATICATGTGYAQTGINSISGTEKGRLAKEGDLHLYGQPAQQYKIERRTMNEANQLTTASHFSLLFSKDSADAFSPGLNLYSTTAGFNAMDISGSGKKAIVMAVFDSSKGQNTTYYYHPSTFKPIVVIVDTGFEPAVLTTETANMRLTGTSGLQHVIFYGNPARGILPSPGCVNTRILSSFMGPTIYTARLGFPGGYFYDRGWELESKPDPDLTGNGLIELISSTSTFAFSGGIGTLVTRHYIYDNLVLIDSVDDRFGLDYAYTTTHDLNNDGRPELVSSIYGAPNLYQWNSTTSRMELLKSLPITSSMWPSAENVDGSPDTEIITVNGGAGDSLIIYTSSFQPKIRLKPPAGLLGGIVRYFVANVNSSPNKEIIVVTRSSSLDQRLSYGTFVYDLSVGASPIFADSSFEAQAVGDFRGVGRNEILGIKRAGTSTSVQQNLRLINPANNFQPAWTRSDSLLSYIKLAGPFLPSPYIVTSGLLTGLLSQFDPIFPLKAADFNGDGVNDFVVEVSTKGNQSRYLAISATGALLDTLPGVTRPSKVLAYDFNGDGNAELLVTKESSSGVTVERAWVFEFDGTSGIGQVSETPARFALHQNYPNPFNPSTNFELQIASFGFVSLKIYDVLGREVATLVNEDLKPGTYKTTWDAHAMPSGVYFSRMQSGDFLETKRMVLLK